MDPLYLYSMYAIFGVYACLMLAAAVFDVTTFLIPNWIVLSVVGLFFVAAVALPFDTPWVSHLGAAAAVFVSGLAAYRFKVLGAGDVKLLTAVSLWAGFEHLPMHLLYIALIGGVIALALVVGRLALINIAIYVPAFEGITRLRLLTNGGGLPYGVAVAAGSLVIARSLPQFGMIL